MLSTQGVWTKYKWVRFQSKSGQISNIEEVDFLNLFLVNEDVNDVEKSKDNNIEIDILDDTMGDNFFLFADAPSLESL